MEHLISEAVFLSAAGPSSESCSTGFDSSVSYEPLISSLILSKTEGSGSKYELMRQLGAGTYGEVYEARLRPEVSSLLTALEPRDMQKHQKVAVKRVFNVSGRNARRTGEWILTAYFAESV